MRTETRSERLIRFIQPWADARPQQYRPSIGFNGCGLRLPLDCLTEHALETLAERIRSDFWRERRSNREGRQAWRANLNLLAEARRINFKKEPEHV